MKVLGLIGVGSLYGFIFSGFFGPSRWVYSSLFSFFALVCTFSFLTKLKFFKLKYLEVLILSFFIYLIIHDVCVNDWNNAIINLWRMFIIIFAIPKFLVQCSPSLKKINVSVISAGVISMFAGLLTYMLQMAYEGRFSMFFYKAHPIQTSVWILFAVICLLFFIVKSTDIKVIISSAVGLIILNLCILFTFSRAGILSCLCGYFFVLLLNRLKSWKVLFVSLLIPFLVFKTCLAHNQLNASTNVISLKEWDLNKKAFGKAYVTRDHISSVNVSLIHDSLSRKSSGRLPYWRKLLSKKNGVDWLIGRGVLSSHDLGGFTSTHSIYIHHLYHYGLIAFGLIIAIQLHCLVHAYKLFKAKRSNGFTFVWIVSSLVHLATNGNELIGSPEPYKILFWLPVILVQMDRHGAHTNKKF